MRPSKRLAVEVISVIALAVQGIRLSEEAQRILKARKRKPTYGFSREFDESDKAFLQRLRRKLDF
jgi:hypothetical protein